MLIVRFWIKIPIKTNEESKLHETYNFLDFENRDDPQIKEMLEDWCADFPQWYNKINYLKFGYDVIPKEEIKDNIKEIIKKEIQITEKNLVTFTKRLNELKELI